MTTFDKREDAFENKFAYDEGSRFRAIARRNRFLAQWAAEKLGLSAKACEEYVAALTEADISQNGDEDVFRRIRHDFDAAGVIQSDHQIRRTMDECMAKAIQDLRQRA